MNAPVKPRTHAPARSGVIAALLALAWASAAGAQNAPANATPCSDSHHREFDFWVGDWEVFTADGKVAGTNRISRVLDGCALEEQWSGARGLRGTSLNSWSALDERWHQTWVDSRGTRLELAGGLVEGRMVLEGDGRTSNGDPVRNRITWEKLEDGRVRQHWQVSGDGGKEWTDAFVGFYVPQAGKKAKAKR